jgi:hypothetical protein
MACDGQPVSVVLCGLRPHGEVRQYSRLPSDWNWSSKMSLARRNRVLAQYTVRIKPVWLEPKYLTHEIWPFAAKSWLEKMVLAQPNWILRAFCVRQNQTLAQPLSTSLSTTAYRGDVVAVEAVLDRHKHVELDVGVLRHLLDLDSG